jgi:hypothetical protein
VSRRTNGPRGSITRLSGRTARAPHRLVSWNIDIGAFRRGQGPPGRHSPRQARWGQMARAPRDRRHPRASRARAPASGPSEPHTGTHSQGQPVGVKPAGTGVQVIASLHDDCASPLPASVLALAMILPRSTRSATRKIYWFPGTFGRQPLSVRSACRPLLAARERRRVTRPAPQARNCPIPISGAMRHTRHRPAPLRACLGRTAAHRARIWPA